MKKNQFMSPETIKEINRIFHEEEAKFYDQRHPEIIRETGNWIDFCENHLKTMKSPVIVLDIGTGTGFVPSIVSRYLKSEDKIISTDISLEMLNIAKKKIENSICQTEFIKTDSEDLSFLEDSSIDLITVNSVLHHLPGYSKFLKEANRVLKNNGVICIMHEPNNLFFNNFLLFFVFRLSSALMSKYNKLAKRKNAKEENNLLLETIIQRLIADGVIKNKINVNDVQSLVDVWSPTAYSKINRSLGFDIVSLKKTFFPDYALLSLRTYNYFGKTDSFHNTFLNVLEKILNSIFPKSGSSFCVIMKKP